MKRRVLMWSATVAFLIVLVGWGWSMFWRYGYVARFGARRYSIITIPNQFAIGVSRGITGPPFPIAPPKPQVLGFHSTPVRSFKIESWWVNRVQVQTVTFVFVPFWMPASLLGIPAVWLWVTECRHDKNCIKRGVCPKCAYPVGSAEVCTECGAPIAQRVES